MLTLSFLILNNNINLKTFILLQMPIDSSFMTMLGNALSGSKIKSIVMENSTNLHKDCRHR